MIKLIICFISILLYNSTSAIFLKPIDPDRGLPTMAWDSEEKKPNNTILLEKNITSEKVKKDKKVNKDKKSQSQKNNKSFGKK